MEKNEFDEDENYDENDPVLNIAEAFNRMSKERQEEILRILTERFGGSTC